MGGIGEMIIVRFVLSIGLNKRRKIMFSDECIYRETWAGNFYEPPEAWCKLDYDYIYDCENCPYRYSKEDYAADKADYEYEKYKYSIDF